ncbi:MAG: hypothetical protein V8T36_10590 [Ruthenibacterium lactatiformans]
MSLEEKLEFFQFLVKLGFKEIEVGFPAASETEYEFLRALIEQHLIPDDVTVQVLTQCRDHIIRRTFDALKGAYSAVVHFYNSTSVAQREQVFKKSKEEIRKIATDGAKLVKSSRRNTRAISALNTPPKALRAPNRNSRSISATRSWTSGSPRRKRLSSTCPARCPCP